ncbi:MAG: transposase, partial [Myxococcota bacterium]
MVGAMSSSGVSAMMTIEGGMTGAAFLQFVKELLVPTLRPGQVVVMDNLAAHKVKGVREAIKGAGAWVMFLPPYSPDLNPIELCWNK